MSNKNAFPPRESVDQIQRKYSAGTVVVLDHMKDNQDRSIMHFSKEIGEPLTYKFAQAANEMKAQECEIISLGLAKEDLHKKPTRRII